jgi:tRNA/rRNA methyltransferase
MKIVFILVNPSLPENVGAAARAMKTMGFDSLRLVRCGCRLDKRALWVAHGSQDLLRAAKTFSSLRAASRGIDFIIGTAARFRNARKDYHGPEQVREILHSKGRSVRAAAVVFGCEESGLSNEDLALCDIVSRVPMKVRYPSLNLAQAVMIYAYTLSPLAGAAVTTTEKNSVDKSQYAALRRTAAGLLDTIGLPAGANPHRRIMERLGLLHEIDMHLAHTVVKKIKQWVR